VNKRERGPGGKKKRGGRKPPLRDWERSLKGWSEKRMTKFKKKKGGGGGTQGWGESSLDRRIKERGWNFDFSTHAEKRKGLVNDGEETGVNSDPPGAAGKIGGGWPGTSQSVRQNENQRRGEGVVLMWGGVLGSRRKRSPRTTPALCKLLRKKHAVKREKKTDREKKYSPNTRKETGKTPKEKKQGKLEPEKKISQETLRKARPGEGGTLGNSIKIGGKRKKEVVDPN